MSRSGKRRRSRLAAAGVALLGMTLLGAAAGHLVTRPPAEPGSYGVREVQGGERLELLGGRIDLPALAKALARDGRTDILTRQDGTWLLSRSLVIRPGATLEVRKATLRLHSEPNRFVGLEARGGNLEITDSTVTSWAPGTGRPDDQVDDGRAWVLARDGAVMNVLRSRMEQLGYARAERSGVAWRTKATSGTIHRSTFAGNWYGAYLSGTRNLRIEDNVFRHNGKARPDPGCRLLQRHRPREPVLRQRRPRHGRVPGLQRRHPHRQRGPRQPALRHRRRQLPAPPPDRQRRLRQRHRPPRPRPLPLDRRPTTTASPPTASTACASPAAPPRSPPPRT